MNWKFVYLLLLCVISVQHSHAKDAVYKSMVLEDFQVVDSGMHRIPAIMYIADSNGKMRMVPVGYLKGMRLYFLLTIAKGDYLVIKTHQHEFYIQDLYSKMSSETAALQIVFKGSADPECIGLSNNGDAIYDILLADLRPTADCPAKTHIWFMNYIKVDFYAKRRNRKRSYLQYCMEQARIVYN